MISTLNETIEVVCYYDNYVMPWLFSWDSWFGAQTSCEPNESYFMVPSWDVFEEASQ